MSSIPPPLLPPALRPGDRIAIVSPASAAKPDRVHAGAAVLHELGFEPVLLPHALASGPLYFAGSLADRLADLHAAFADPSLRAVLCTRGGWGSAELLPHLDLDLIRRNPKPFLGYSDHTSLHIWLAEKAGLVTFYAPMLSPDFARGPARGLAHGPAQGIHLPSFLSALSAPAPWHLGPEAGLRLLRPALNPNTTEYTGTLWGGCLAILAEALGTPFAPRPRPGSLLFLEDVGVKPYQWDRLLVHLRFAGLLEGVHAILLGDMRQCAPPAEQPFLEAAILHSLRDFPGPILIGLQSGHVDTPNVTLPLNLPATLRLADPQHPELHFPEPAVTSDPRL